MEIMNQVRGYSYLFIILKNQPADPFCRSCNAFIKTLAAVREGIEQFECQHGGDIGKMPKEFVELFSNAKNGIMQISQPESPVSQKKAGNCKLPEGVCFMKTSLTMLQKI